MRAIVLAVALTMAAGTVRAAECSIGAPTLVANLFFGRSLHGGGEVSDADWSDFLASVVTPRFPDGLTVVTAHGQWRPRGGTRVIGENSWLVVIATDAGAATDRKLQEIRDAYAHRFGQESVGLVTTAGCALF